MNESPIRVCHLASFYESNQLYDRLTSALAGLDVSQTVISPRGFDNSDISNSSIDYFGDKIWDKFDKLLFFRKQRKYRSFLLQYPSISSFDLLHAHSLYSDGAAAYWLKQTVGTPYIITIRHSDLAYFTKYGIHLRALARKILSASSHIIFVNNNYRERLFSDLNVTIDKAKTSVVPNGLAPFWLERSPRHQVDTGSELKILSVAELKGDKNQKTLVEAVRSYNRTRTEFQPLLQLTVAGKCESRYGRKLRKKHESENIIFTGKLPFSEIAEKMSQSDMFALLSSPENFGIAYSEAVSQGLPVIYSKGEGFDGWVEEGIWGYSCESHDQKYFIELVLKIGKNNHLSTDAIEKLKQRFNWPRIAASVRDIYEKAIGNE